MQDIDRENMIELLTKLSDIQMGLIKADIAKSSNNSRDIVNSFIKNINATFSKQAEKYGININQNMEMRKNIEAIISKYEEVFQKIEDVFDEAIAEQISRKSDLQLKIISVINSRMENQKEKNRYSINDLEQINYLKNEIENADAIVIGAGAGLSTSAGLNYSGERFEKYFFDFSKKF